MCRRYLNDVFVQTRASVDWSSGPMRRGRVFCGASSMKPLKTGCAHVTSQKAVSLNSFSRPWKAAQCRYRHRPKFPVLCHTRFSWLHFYRAMLCIRGTSHGPVSVCLSVCPSVCLSVTSRCSTKTAKRRITQTTPHDSTGTLVSWRQRSPRNSTGITPYEGTECRWGGSKSATFDQ